MSGSIRAVLGDVPADSLSGFDAHEHLFLDLGAHLSRASMLLASADEALDELNELRRAGGGAVVCAIRSSSSTFQSLRTSASLRSR